MRPIALVLASTVLVVGCSGGDDGREAFLEDSLELLPTSIRTSILAEGPDASVFTTLTSFDGYATSLGVEVPADATSDDEALGRWTRVPGPSGAGHAFQGPVRSTVAASATTTAVQRQSTSFRCW